MRHTKNSKTVSLCRVSVFLEWMIRRIFGVSLQYVIEGWRKRTMRSFIICRQINQIKEGKMKMVGLLKAHSDERYSHPQISIGKPNENLQITKI